MPYILGGARLDKIRAGAGDEFRCISVYFVVFPLHVLMFLSISLYFLCISLYLLLFLCISLYFLSFLEIAPWHRKSAGLPGQPDASKTQEIQGNS